MKDETARIQVTTTVSLRNKRIVKANNWKWHELLSLGIQTKINGDRRLETIEELQKGNEKLQKRLTEMSARLFRLEEKEAV